MKKTIVSVILALACLAGYAQKHMVVNTEKIFKALPKYTEAIESLDKQAKDYQGIVDAKYSVIERMYNDYQAQKNYLTVSARQGREEAITAAEQEAEKYQESIFGTEGELMKKRIERIKPIQDEVFGAINAYAEKNGYTLVLDITSNPTVLYYAPSVDKTEEIIKIVKK